ncbi:MAG: hypothetical protein IKF80_01740 [Erysipelotrichaceae bacterium]|nr:hypothetical protein [Erysipelotrichaceae bacterium]
MRHNERFAESELPESYMLHRYEDKNGTEWSSIVKGDAEIIYCRRNKEQQMIRKFNENYKSIN